MPARLEHVLHRFLHREGLVRGRWNLGAGGGECFGAVLWLDAGHVVRLIGQGVQDLHDVVPAEGAAQAPWRHSCAGECGQLAWK